MAESPAPTKRARTSPRQEGTPQCAKEVVPIDVSLQPFKHLTHARFPPAILGLPHVLKQIDTLLLSPQEAMVEAAGTGQSDWLDELLTDYSCVALDAIEAAAANGHLYAVDILVDADFNQEEKLPTEKREALKKAVVAAAKGGHVDIVEYLLPLVTDPDPYSGKPEKCWVVWEAFTEAAANGHVEVLEFMTRYEDITHYLSIYHGAALALAIKGQHTRVVDFLLSKRKFDWSLLDAFEEAVAQGQAATAERLYNVYPLFRAERNLFVESAREGRKEAVEYLLTNGFCDSELMCDAFVRATEFGRTNVVRFLYETGLISPDAFGKACDCATKWSCRSGTVLYLYGLKCASAQTLNQWFEGVRDVTVLKLLYENEAISNPSIVTGFNKAARCVSDEDVEIVKLLYQDKSITSDSIDKAFVCAVGKRQSDVIELLQNDCRLTPKGIDEGFVEAVENHREKMAQTLYDQHKISPSGLVSAYERAVSNESFSLVELIVDYLSAENVPRDYKLKAVMCAVKRSETSALELLLDNESGDWPIDELENALRVAWHSPVKHLIRKTICDQLFSGRPQHVRASADCGHRIKTLEWTKEE